MFHPLGEGELHGHWAAKHLGEPDPSKAFDRLHTGGWVRVAAPGHFGQSIYKITTHSLRRSGPRDLIADFLHGLPPQQPVQVGDSQWQNYSGQAHEVRGKLFGSEHLSRPGRPRRHARTTDIDGMHRAVAENPHDHNLWSKFSDTLRDEGHDSLADLALMMGREGHPNNATAHDSPVMVAGHTPAYGSGQWEGAGALGNIAGVPLYLQHHRPWLDDDVGSFHVGIYPPQGMGGDEPDSIAFAQIPYQHGMDLLRDMEAGPNNRTLGDLRQHFGLERGDEPGRMARPGRARKYAHPDRDAFLNAINDHPLDNAPKLVYADWLQEQERPRDLAAAMMVRHSVQPRTKVDFPYNLGTWHEAHVADVDLDPDADVTEDGYTDRSIRFVRHPKSKYVFATLEERFRHPDFANRISKRFTSQLTLKQARQVADTLGEHSGYLHTPAGYDDENVPQALHHVLDETYRGQIMSRPGKPRRYDVHNLRGPVDPDERYLYHATNKERARDIADSGIGIHRPSDFTDQDAWPDGSTEKRNYFGRADNVWMFAPEEGYSTILRVKADAHPFKRESTGDYYSKKPIPPDLVQILGNDGKWRPIKEHFAEADRKSRPERMARATPSAAPQPQAKPAHWRSPAGGMVVRGNFYQGGKLVPGEATGKAVKPKTRKIAGLLRDLRSALVVKYARHDIPGLWKAVLENPEDEAPWGILADALDEAGKPAFAAHMRQLGRGRWESWGNSRGARFYDTAPTDRTMGSFRPHRSPNGTIAGIPVDINSYGGLSFVYLHPEAMSEPGVGTVKPEEADAIAAEIDPQEPDPAEPRKSRPRRFAAHETNDEAFRTAIDEKPHDDAPKLVYADYLDENGREDEANIWREMVATQGDEDLHPKGWMAESEVPEAYDLTEIPHDSDALFDELTTGRRHREFPAHTHYLGSGSNRRRIAYVSSPGTPDDQDRTKTYLEWLDRNADGSLSHLEPVVAVRSAGRTSMHPEVRAALGHAPRGYGPAGIQHIVTAHGDYLVGKPTVLADLLHKIRHSSPGQSQEKNRSGT